MRKERSRAPSVLRTNIRKWKSKRHHHQLPSSWWTQHTTDDMRDSDFNLTILLKWKILCLHLLLFLKTKKKKLSFLKYKLWKIYDKSYQLSYLLWFILHVCVKRRESTREYACKYTILEIFKNRLRPFKKL